MPRKYTNYSKQSKNPRRPFEKEKLINDLTLPIELSSTTVSSSLRTTSPKRPASKPALSS